MTKCILKLLRVRGGLILIDGKDADCTVLLERSGGGGSAANGSDGTRGGGGSYCSSSATLIGSIAIDLRGNGYDGYVTVT